MPAIIANCTLVNLSYTADALTLYPTFPYYSKRDLRNCLQVFQRACNKFDFVIKVVDKATSTPTNQNFVHALEDIRDHLPAFQSFVRRDDEGHMLYHDDQYKLTDSHWHIKFNCLLNQQQLKAILEVATKFEIITQTEKTKFLAEVADYYKSAKNILQVLIPEGKNVEIDVRAIIRFVRSCRSNDVLREVHNFLLEPAYDYLRTPSARDLAHKYQGSTSNHSIAPTSAEWTWLEKSIVAQIAYNIQEKVSKFTPTYGTAQALKYAQVLSFFAAPATSDAKICPIYDALCKGEQDDLNKARKLLMPKSKL